MKDNVSNDYYPFGLTFNEYQNQGEEENNFLYNGKELQTELGLDWYDYGARMYDAAIGRWHVQDPYSEMFIDITPYNYALNNPSNTIDPDGMFSMSLNGNRLNKKEKEEALRVFGIDKHLKKKENNDESGEEGESSQSQKNEPDIEKINIDDGAYGIKLINNLRNINNYYESDMEGSRTVYFDEIINVDQLHMRGGAMGGKKKYSSFINVDGLRIEVGFLIQPNLFKGVKYDMPKSGPSRYPSFMHKNKYGKYAGGQVKYRIEWGQFFIHILVNSWSDKAANKRDEIQNYLKGNDPINKRSEL